MVHFRFVGVPLSTTKYIFFFFNRQKQKMSHNPQYEIMGFTEAQWKSLLFYRLHNAEVTRKSIRNGWLFLRQVSATPLKRMGRHIWFVIESLAYNYGSDASLKYHLHHHHSIYPVRSPCVSPEGTAQEEQERRVYVCVCMWGNDD